MHFQMNPVLSLSDPKLWGNEAADDEDLNILNSYFTYQESFDRFFSEETKFLIARARKGMGKSALLRNCEYYVKDKKNAIVVSLSGSDLVAQKPIKYFTPDEHIHDWQQRICMCINRKLGSEIGLALNDDNILLVETAELSGFKKRNIVSSLITRFKSKLAPLEINQQEIKDHHQLLKRVSYEENWVVWVFIDDIDATFISKFEESLRLSTFFSACRDLATSFKGINIRTCVRTDVWASIRNVDESLDKVDQYIFDVNWSIKQIGQMLCNRIESYKQRLNIATIKSDLKQSYQGDCIEENKNYKQEFNLLNDVFAPKFPWGRSKVSPHRVVHAYAGGRPRWAMQLCRMAGECAMVSKDTEIKFGHLKMCLEAYGRKRIDDLVREHQHQCPQIMDIINSFSHHRSKYTTAELLGFLDTVIMKNISVTIDDKLTNNSLEVARFLFRIEFIVGMAKRGSGTENYCRFEDRPELFRSYANLDDKMIWNVQAVFHKILQLEK